MRLALAAGAIVGVLAPAVGFFLVQRRQSLFGDGIGHVAFAGVAAGILFDVSPVLTALVFAVRRRDRDRAAALARRHSRRPGARTRLLYGHCARGRAHRAGGGIERRPLPVPLRLDPHRHPRRPRDDRAARRGSGSRRSRLLYRAFAAVVIDEEGARVAGVPIGTLNVVARSAHGGHGGTVDARRRNPPRRGADGAPGERGRATRAGACARRSSCRLRSASLSAIAGLTVSYYADLPPGGTIVLVAAAAYLVGARRHRGPRK